MGRVADAVRRLRSINILVAAVVVAAMALAYYSYRYTRDLASRGEQSIVDTNRDLAEGLVSRIEQDVVDSDQTLFDLVDLQNLREFPRRWSDISRQAPAIESAIILNEEKQIVPDGYVSKKRSKKDVDAFRERFEQQILPELELSGLKNKEHKHLHKEFGGRYVLMSYTRRYVDERYFDIVLEIDLAYLVGEMLPESFAGVDARRVYQVIDEHNNIVFGHPFSDIPERYIVELPLSATLYKWRVRMAPREAPSLQAKESKRRLFDLVLIGLSAVTVFVGLGILSAAVRAERRASQAKSDFIANVSHELKTPLSLIRIFGELLATGRTKGPGKAREYANIVMRESERLTHLIDNVLDFSRAEQKNKGTYDLQVADMADVVTRGLDVYRYQLESEGMKLSVDIDDNLPTVSVDENAIILVLLNLVDNALKYAKDGKEIAVSLTSNGDRVVLAVRDQGPGIEADEVDRVFERFYRAKRVRGQPIRGSGIGLALVKRIAEDHGGGVKLDTTPGQGSTFSVWVPAAQAKGHAA